MKKLIALLAFGLFACSGAPDAEIVTTPQEVDATLFDSDAMEAPTDEPFEDSVSEDQLGVATQALTSPSGYGQENSSAFARCFSPFDGGFCFAPKVKNGQNVASACGGDVEAAQSCLTAKTDALNQLHTGTGFNYNLVTIDNPTRHAVVKTGTVPGNSLFAVQYVFQNEGNGIQTPNGTYKRWTRCEVILDVDKLKSLFPGPFYNNPDATRRKNAYYNLYMKGFGLCAGGLGQVSAQQAVMTNGNPRSLEKNAFTSTELAFMAGYQP